MIPTRSLLAQLNAHIVHDDGDTLTIQVVPDVPEATVQIKHADLRAWCMRRLETRATHKHKAISGSGGSRGNNGTPRHIV